MWIQPPENIYNIYMTYHIMETTQHGWYLELQSNEYNSSPCTQACVTNLDEHGQSNLWLKTVESAEPQEQSFLIFINLFLMPIWRHLSPTDIRRISGTKQSLNQLWLFLLKSIYSTHNIRALLKKDIWLGNYGTGYPHIITPHQSFPQ